MFSPLTELKTVVALIFISQLTFEVTPASPAYIHSLQKERIEDGAYVARDYNHIVEGEHHSEFDHEAILGKDIIYLLGTLVCSLNIYLTPSNPLLIYD